MALLMAKDTRAALGDRPAIKNRSLLYDKYVPVGFENDAAKKRDKEAALQALKSSGVADDQGARSSLPEALLSGARPAKDFVATLGARMMVNMAGGVIENAGLCFDRHFGMPYIPGTALKGIALRAAREAGAGASEEEITAVFGEQDPKKDSKRGGVSFLPAYPEGGAGIELDVMTCHHMKYYHGDIPVALDNEDPNPVKFPAVAAGARFRFVVVGVSKDIAQKLVEQAAEWLRKGVTDRGLGAKTAAGYGWFEYDEEAERRRAEEKERKHRELEAARRKAEVEKARREAMDPIEREMDDLRKMSSEDFAHFARALREKTPEQQGAFVRLIGSREMRDKWKTWKKRKKDLADSIRAVAAELGEELP